MPIRAGPLVGGLYALRVPQVLDMVGASCTLTINHPQKNVSGRHFLDQRSAIAIGHFGGAFNDGEFSKDLYLEDLNEYNIVYAESGSSVTQLYLGYGFVGIDTNAAYNGVANTLNGRLATIQMAENAGDLQVNRLNSGTGTISVPNPIKQNGQVMPYQYTNYNAFAARYCYDKNRAENPNFYVQVPLCEYSETGNESIIKRDDKGDTIFVRRVRRHGNFIKDQPTMNSNVSSRFLIAPNCIDMDGNPVVVSSSNPKTWRVSWANAMGYLASANTTGPDIEQYAVEKGCALYRGKNGTDTPGSWRMPTQREMLLVGMFIDSFNNLLAETGSAVFIKGTSNGASGPDDTYWTATENPQSTTPSSSTGKVAWRFRPINTGVSNGGMSNEPFGGDKYSDARLVRCIRDIPPTN